MLSYKKKITLFIAALLSFVSLLKCIDLDATVTVSYSGLNGTCLFNSGSNSATGFTFFRSGFTLPNSSSNVTLSLSVPLSGPIKLAGGTMTLTSDLIMNTDSSFGSGGMINVPYSNSIVFLGKQILPGNSPLHFFQGQSAKIVGHGNQIDFSAGGSIFLDSGTTLTISDAKLINLNPSSIVMTDSTSLLCFQDCELQSYGSSYTVTHGKIFFSGDCRLSRGNITLSSGDPFTVHSSSRLLLDTGTTFSYQPTIANRDLIRFFDNSSYFHLKGCTLTSSATGMRITTGTVLLDDYVIVQVGGAALSEAIQFGDNNLGSIKTQLLGGAYLEVQAGYLRIY